MGIKKWLRMRLRSWLGVEANQSELRALRELHKDLVSIGVDVHFKEQSMILVYTHLGGGQIRHIPGRFDNLSDLRMFVERLRSQFRTDVLTVDAPPQSGIREFISRSRY